MLSLPQDGLCDLHEQLSTHLFALYSLEKLVHKRLVNFIDKKYNILYVNRFGFREKHSTMLATLLMTDKIQRATEDGLFSCGIFLDFPKAFDTVDRSILIRKLIHYGIRGIANDWFTS